MSELMKIVSDRLWKMLGSQLRSVSCGLASNEKSVTILLIAGVGMFDSAAGVRYVLNFQSRNVPLACSLDYSYNGFLGAQPKGKESRRQKWNSAPIN